MPIPFACPHCGLETLVDDQYAGQTGNCAGCDKPITVPYVPASQNSGDAEVIVGIAHARRRSVGLGVALVLGGLIAGVGALGLLWIVFFPALGSIRAVANHRACSSNLERIAEALRAYEAEHGSLPPAYLADEAGKPMHSWRVLILPYLGEARLYGQYDFDQPWDGPQNSQLFSEMPAVYACPADPDARVLGESNYFVLVGNETLFPGAQARFTSQISDDLSTTIVVVEVPVSGSPWLEPKDLQADGMQFVINGLYGQEIGGHHEDGAHVVTADGTAHLIPASVPPDFVRAMSTIGGGEPVPPSVLEGF